MCPVDAASGSRWPSESSVVNSVEKEGGQGVGDGGLGHLPERQRSRGVAAGALGWRSWKSLCY